MYGKNSRPVSTIHSTRSVLAEKIVCEAHKITMHGGVISAVAAVRENYWIAKLQQLTKKVIRNCIGCKRFQIKPFPTPPQGQLPIDRTTGSMSFQVIVQISLVLPYHVSRQE